jgi:hypothetical protein
MLAGARQLHQTSTPPVILTDMARSRAQIYGRT